MLTVRPVLDTFQLCVFIEYFVHWLIRSFVNYGDLCCRGVLNMLFEDAFWRCLRSSVFSREWKAGERANEGVVRLTD